MRRYNYKKADTCSGNLLLNPPSKSGNPNLRWWLLHVFAATNSWKTATIPTTRITPNRYLPLRLNFFKGRTDIIIVLFLSREVSFINPIATCSARNDPTTRISPAATTVRSNYWWAPENSVECDSWRLSPSFSLPRTLLMLRKPIMLTEHHLHKAKLILFRLQHAVVPTDSTSSVISSRFRRPTRHKQVSRMGLKSHTRSERQAHWSEEGGV